LIALGRAVQAASDHHRRIPALAWHGWPA